MKIYCYSNTTASFNGQFHFWRKQKILLPHLKERKRKNKNKIQRTKLLLIIPRHQCYLNITFGKFCIVRKCLLKKFFLGKNCPQGETSTQNKDKVCVCGGGGEWHFEKCWISALKYQHLSLFKKKLKNSSLYIKLTGFFVVFVGVFKKKIGWQLNFRGWARS